MGPFLLLFSFFFPFLSEFDHLSDPALLRCAALWACVPVVEAARIPWCMRKLDFLNHALSSSL